MVASPGQVKSDQDERVEERLYQMLGRRAPGRLSRPCSCKGRPSNVPTRHRLDRSLSVEVGSRAQSCARSLVLVAH